MFLGIVILYMINIEQISSVIGFDIDSEIAQILCPFVVVKHLWGFPDESAVYVVKCSKGSD